MSHRETQRRRGWKKLHLDVDRSGVIVAHALIEATVDDATTGIDLIEATDGHVASVTADTAYDTIAFYDAGWCAGRARRGSTRQDGKSVLAATAVKRSRSYDQRGEG